MNSKIHEEAKKLGLSHVACTVGELKALLNKLPDSTPISCTGADIGGYDISTQPYVALLDAEEGILFSHLEYGAYHHKPPLVNLMGEAE